MGTSSPFVRYLSRHKLPFHISTPTDHSTSRCTVVTINNMYSKAITLAILAVAGVQAQPDCNYGQHLLHAGPHRRRFLGLHAHAQQRHWTLRHRRLREALLDLVWLLSAFCKPVESSR